MVEVAIGGRGGLKSIKSKPLAMQSPRAVPVVVGALLSIRFEKDNQMHWLEKECVSGEGSGVDNGGGVCRSGVKKKASAATKIT